MAKPIETKNIGGNVVEAKEIERDGIKIGIVEGYIATWDLDRGGWWARDQFVKGAFAESIRDHQIKKRQVRLKDHHGRTIGGFPPESLREDDRGLFGIGEINLDVQQGKEAFSLAKQGVLTDFSIGFTSLSDVDSMVDEERIRTIHKATIWEGSIVDEPMNPEANITEVKVMAEDIKDWTERDLEKFLRDTGGMSKSAAKAISARFDKAPKQADNNTDDLKRLVDEMKSLAEQVAK